FFSCPTFFRSAAWNTTSGCEFFLIVDGKREEVLPVFYRFSGSHCAQHNRFAEGREHRAISLTSNTARFKSEGLSAPLHFNFLYIKHSYFPLSRLPYAMRGLSFVQQSG